MIEKTEIKKCCHSFFPAEDSVMIVGVANAGLVGNICATHIIEQMGLREIAYLYSSLFPPISVATTTVLQAIASRMLVLIPSINEGWIKISEPRIKGIVCLDGKYPK